MHCESCALSVDFVTRLCEGGKKKPYCGTRQAAISRILAAGYSEAAEEAHHVKQKAADEAAAAHRAKEIAARKVEQDRKDAISREKAAKAKVTSIHASRLVAASSEWK